MTDEQLDDYLYKEMKQKLEHLERQNAELLEEVRRVEGEKRYVESELFRLQKEIKRMRSEMERLKSPPLIIGSIKDVLVDGRVIVKSSTGPDFIVSTSEYVPTEDITVGARVALNKQTLAVMSVLPASLDPIVIGAEIVEKPAISYNDIGGLEEQIREIREAVEDPLLRPELYKRVGIEPPKGVLLVGPPGTGKTLLAKAVAHQTNATFIRMVGSELVQKYIGEGARLVRELFEMAKDKSPSIDHPSILAIVTVVDQGTTDDDVSGQGHLLFDVRGVAFGAVVCPHLPPLHLTLLLPRPHMLTC